MPRPTNLPPRLRPPLALIFDMDGTIVDTRPFHMAAWRKLVEDRGLGEREYRIAEASFGKTNWAIFGEWFGGAAGAPDFEELAAEKEADFRELIKGQVAPRRGFYELLGRARDRGLKIALATSGPRENAEFLLGELGVRGQFDAVVWGDPEIRSKPHPASFITAAARLGVAPQRCVVFEDSDHGLWAARRASAQIVAIVEKPGDWQHHRRWTDQVHGDFRGLLK